MKRYITLLLFSMLLGSCKALQNQSVSVENKTNLTYKDKVISLSYPKIKEKLTWLNDSNFKVVNSKNQQEVPYQLEFLGNKTPLNLLVQLSLKEKEKIQLVFLKEKPSDFPTKTFGRYVPERADDFAWENDKIAFRAYGKALELNPKQNAYGIDVWVKRTTKMVINDRYSRGKYHEDHGDGMDYYHVGYTLGAGNCAPYVNDSIWYSKNYTRYEILDNGPLRTTFKLYYDAWNVDGHVVKATKTISLDAGSQLNQVEMNYQVEGLTHIPIVIGIIKRDQVGTELFDIKGGVLSYWEPTEAKYGTTGVGVIIPTKVNNMYLRKDQYLAFTDVPTNATFKYYTGAVWDRAGEITTSKEWFAYLQAYKEQLKINRVKISY
ncbi:hypothetical protein B6A10_15275 [Flavobacterium sp. L1I52]|uniref:DUF4861 domain-containing protein n=1 Tax=Flavobacterium pokkalii TaxID=1940408 RepID=A0ABR7UUN5_9FLAO|nr:DUF4861 family protein [Flavobacterium pokkalii]MBD0726535.1 hypothetical protein [Flavobacterium pokkalii]